MRIGLIGIGQAGGKITDKLLEYDAEVGSYFIQDCVAINTAKQDLNGLENVPDDKQILIGESVLKANGVGADNTKGRDIMQKEVNEVMSIVDNMPLHKIDAFLVVAALGGGTGSGGMPVLCKELRKRFTEPVFGLGVLPSESEGRIYTINAARTLEPCVEHTDNLLLFDNDAWSRGRGSIEDWYDQLNTRIAERFGNIFAAGEIGESDKTAESVVDASEIINTLECGGISTVGYAQSELDKDEVNPSLLRRLLLKGKSVDEGEATTRMRTLTKQSITGQLTIPANVESTQRALLIFSGPPQYLVRKGMEEGRALVESQTNCMEVRGGDYPRPNYPYVNATVLLSGVHDIPRIKELQEIAVEADDKIEELRQEKEAELDKLLKEEEAEEIDNLLD